MNDETRLVFNKFTVSGNELYQKLRKMNRQDAGDYIINFVESMIFGEPFDDDLLLRTYTDNVAYQSKKRGQQIANNIAVKKHRAKKAETTEPTKPATPPKPTPKPTLPKPPKFNALEAVESFARSDEEQEVLIEFVKMRAEKKKPISRIAFNALAKKLADLSVSDSIASVRKSIENDWQGVFPESLKPRTFEREKSGAEKFMERVLREDLEEKNRQLKLRNEVKCELERC